MFASSNMPLCRCRRTCIYRPIGRLSVAASLRLPKWYVDDAGHRVHIYGMYDDFFLMCTVILVFRDLAVDTSCMYT